MIGIQLNSGNCAFKVKGELAFCISQMNRPIEILNLDFLLDE